MNILWGFHAWSEKNILNTLTKKIMSIILLFFFNLLYLGIFFVVKGSVLETLSSSGTNAEAAGHRIGI
jgi:methyl-accepting chemotaxis protein